MEEIDERVRGLSKYQAKQVLSWEEYNLWLDYLEMLDRWGVEEI